MIVFSVVYLVVGIALLLQPTRMSNLLGLMIGIVATVIGVYRLISYFRNQRLDSMLATDLFVGICLIVSGFLCIVFYDRVLEYAPVILAFLFAAGGIMKLQNAVNMQKLGYDLWWIAAILSLVSLGGAVLSIIRPDFVKNHFLAFVAVMFIYEAVSGIATLVMAEKYYNELRKNPQLAFAGHVRAEAFAASAFGARADVPAIGTSKEQAAETATAEVYSENGEEPGVSGSSEGTYAGGNTEAAAPGT
ncbi:MAG: DUF308 domain-containing protein, partial [Lachnospiraceae bacterium]|nr:DUF308 domain-containing protein [Lachnospiraceae bacterium]